MERISTQLRRLAFELTYPQNGDSNDPLYILFQQLENLRSLIDSSISDLFLNPNIFKERLRKDPYALLDYLKENILSRLTTFAGSVPNGVNLVKDAVSKYYNSFEGFNQIKDLFLTKLEKSNLEKGTKKQIKQNLGMIEEE